jgi:hypothetical protein
MGMLAGTTILVCDELVLAMGGLLALLLFVMSSLSRRRYQVRRHSKRRSS